MRDERRRELGRDWKRHAILGITYLTLGCFFRGTASAQVPTTGKGLYTIGCAKCHGADGKGVDLDLVGFNLPLPDFSDCRFANREADLDWLAVTHRGGPARGFDTTMPAYAEAFDDEQIQRIIDYLRTFCADSRWPRGELNLPLALVTEKAFPEDEVVWRTTVAADEPSFVLSEFVYERRFGPRNQVEIKVPFGAAQGSSGGRWHGGIGDIALGMKRALYHSFERGSIFSVAGELRLPTGDEETNLGKGSVVLEPFVALGQIVGQDGFLQFQSGLEVPTEETREETEAFWRLVLGGTWYQDRFARSWSPMIELLGSMEWAERKLQWDVVPQIQFSLSTRQHLRANVGLRVPVTDAEARPAQVLFYFLWDWFDGGLTEGW